MAQPWAESTQSFYASRGIGGRLAPLKKPAVIVVDLIKGFTDPSFPAGSDLTSVVSCTRQVLDAAREANAPVIFTTIAFSPLQARTMTWLRKMTGMRALLEGSVWTEVDERLGRRVDDEPVISKQAASSFTGTHLASMLVDLHVDGVIITGAVTSGCVRATAVDACMAGWPVFVPAECVGDRAQGPHEANLFDIQAKYGEVCSLSDALAMLAPTR
ncbi:carbamoylsarcosine amidase [Burkholderia sp. MSh2]|uniref:Isochorismatase hydrolase n=1 Tax=Burkholderia paludis TaxID=1506587 RepID=A0A6J5F1K1_9BURK|nr:MULTISPECIES: isochorismatase family protein [Burkholderia]KEZ01309.1 carbamoylsarcosine amidase [Burkholderia sp. MSh2]CAB3772678.1 Maleamate amidohydrolase [Burkholderia paludis]VWB63799.1 isochorismatase hydrolase [Burkholderia paludis]